MTQVLGPVANRSRDIEDDELNSSGVFRHFSLSSLNFYLLTMFTDVND